MQMNSKHLCILNNVLVPSSVIKIKYFKIMGAADSLR